MFKIITWEFHLQNDALNILLKVFLHNLKGIRNMNLYFE